MVQALPRYCQRCKSPMRPDLQHCVVCGLTSETTQNDPDNNQSETSAFNPGALQAADVLTSGYMQPEDRELLWRCQLNRHEPSQAPRFAPRSPLPPELTEWDTPDKQSTQPGWPAQEEQCVALAPSLIGEQAHTIDLSDAPDSQATSSAESMLSHAVNRQPETDEYDSAALQRAITNGSPEAQQENDLLLQSEAPEIRNSPSAWDRANDSTQLPHTAPLATPPGESGRLPVNEQILAMKPEVQPDPADQTEIQEAAMVVSRDSQAKISESKEQVDLSGQNGADKLDWNETDDPTFIDRFPRTFSPLTRFDRPKASGARKRRDFLFVVLAILWILGIGGSNVIYVKHFSNPHRPSAPIKTQAPATTAGRNTRTKTPYVASGTLIFSDSLQRANTNWDQNTNCAFKDGSYHVTATTIQSCALNTHVLPKDFILEIKMKLLKGDVGGLFFRKGELDGQETGYLLDLDSKGNYQLWNYGAHNSLKLVAEGISGNFVAGYNRTSTLALVAQGASLTLYMNGHIVRQMTDKTYQSGGLSLISSEYAEHKGSSEVAYNNLHIWRL